MKKTLIFLFALLNFSNSHLFGEQIIINDPDENEWKNGETNIYSNSKEMAPCTCNLTSHCDIYCCCDTKCSEDDIKIWEDNSLCLNKNKKWVEDYMCKSAEETFKYNKNKAGINIRDHIFNIMCIKYDRSCDMVNYYEEYNEEADKSKINELKDEWINKFFGQTTTTRILEENYKYGQKIKQNENLILYKADSNGNCIKADAYFLIPFESSCIDLNNKIKDEIEKDSTIVQYNKLGDNIISEITYDITYKSDDQLKVNKKALYTAYTSNIINFKVQWTKGSATQTKNFPSGYLQGNPIKIKFEVNSYNYGYYFNIYDHEGNCIESIENSFNPMSILFKNNIFISCKYDKSKSPKNYLIYKIYTDIIHENLVFFSAPNAIENIKIINKTDTNFGKDNMIGNNIKMNLIFLTTQKGKENSPYDIIQTVYLKMESEKVEDTSTEEAKISLNIKFVDFSYSTIINSKNNKITNSISLPQKLLEKLSE